uniref:GB1/RHD3-type G domain-containing protein n=1 Tax=Chrysemys picta bellii TaxID=8478 RepID=A0A8C3FA36_CHRPI
MWIFALAVLLSSTLVYNSKGTIDQQAMEQLHYVTELTELIKVKPVPAGEGGRDSAEFVRFFPAFVWAVRDFALQLLQDGQEITEDEYLENALKLKPGRGAHYNLPRKCIRQFFPARKCFGFVPPAGWQHLARLEELREDELEPKFQEQVAQFCRHVWETSKPKTLLGGHVVTGAMLGNLAVTYVDAIRSGAVPCMESAVLALAQIENSAAVGEAVAVYEEQLEWRAALPTETVQELLDLHVQCEQEALRAFMARAFKDDDRRFQGELMVRPLKQKQELCQRNEVASSDRCRAALLELSQELDDRIGEGVYSVPGGYQRFLDDRQRMVDRYRQVPGKGAKVGEGWSLALSVCASPHSAAQEALLRASGAASECRARAEAAEQEQQVLKQKEAELQQKLEVQDRSYEENLRQLETKLEDDRKKLLEEQGKMVDQKLMVQGGGAWRGGNGWAQPREGHPCHRPQPARGWDSHAWGSQGVTDSQIVPTLGPVRSVGEPPSVRQPFSGVHSLSGSGPSTSWSHTSLSFSTSVSAVGPRRG